MFSSLELVDAFDEFDYCLEYGSLGIVKLEDGFWFCNRDEECSILNVEWRKAPIQMQDAYNESRMDSEELFIHQENLAAEEIIASFEQPSEQSISLQNHDYFGSRDKIINEQMAGAFEPPFGSDFNL